MMHVIFSLCEQIFLYIPLILGAYISISLLKIPHLALDMAFVFGAVGAGKMLALLNNTNTTSCLFVAITASIVSGLAVGLVTSLLHTYGKLPHLLADITTIGLFFGINIFLLQGPYMQLQSNPLALGPIQNYPEFFAILFISTIVLIAMRLFANTQISYSCAIYGMNQRFFDFYNQSSACVVIIGLIVSSALAALSGYLVAQTSGFVDINAGQGIALFCITSLVIGKATIKTKKVFSLLLPCTGIFAYCFLQQVLLYSGFNGKYFPLIQALIVAGALIMQYRKNQTQTLDLFMGV